MKALIVGLLLAGFAATGAYATPVTDAQKVEFKQVCLSISHDETLCQCKVEAAPKLIDERMMGYVIAGMKGAGNAPDDVQREWNNYVAKSNQICKPNY